MTNNLPTSSPVVEPTTEPATKLVEPVAKPGKGKGKDKPRKLAVEPVSPVSGLVWFATLSFEPVTVSNAKKRREYGNDGRLIRLGDNGLKLAKAIAELERDGKAIDFRLLVGTKETATFGALPVRLGLVEPGTRKPAKLLSAGAAQFLATYRLLGCDSETVVSEGTIADVTCDDATLVAGLGFVPPRSQEERVKFFRDYLATANRRGFFRFVG